MLATPPPGAASDEAPSAVSLPVLASSRLRGWFTAALVLVLCLVATGWFWQVVRQHAEERAATRFEYRTERIRSAILDQLNDYDASLRSIAGLVTAVTALERPHWRAYFQAIGDSDHYPGRVALAFAPRVPATARDEHIARVRSEGPSGYEVQADGPRDEYFPLAYLRIFGTSGVARLGMDIGSDPAARAAMERARDTGKGMLSAPLRMAKSAAEEDQVAALVVPVYRADAPVNTVEDRRSALQGYVLELFEPMPALGAALAQDANVIGLKVQDATGSLFTCPEMRRALAEGFRPRLERTANIDFGGRAWQLHFVALPGFQAAHFDGSPDLVLIGGLLVSVLLAALVGATANTRTQALATAHQRTAELGRVLARSEEGEARMAAIYDHALDAIITIDARGVIEGCNPAAERTFGYTAAEMIGRPVNMLMPEPDRRQHDRYISNYVDTGVARVIGTGREVLGMRKDGTTFSLELGISEMRVRGRQLFCGFVRDITERRRAEAALQQERELLEDRVAERTEVLTRTNRTLESEIVERRRIEGELVAAREEARQAADAKAGFLANMSHEIRTPMNAVLGTAALLEDTRLDPEQREFVETIRVGGQALLRTINDILDFSKIDSGMLDLESRPVELVACVEEALGMLAASATEKRLELFYVLADDVPPWILGDAARLQQVLVNLVSNAIKFTEHGEICVTVGCARRAEGRFTLQFVVRDTGIGIAPDKRERLFKAFSQADSSTTRKYGGTGLGLAICARLVHLMGGDIWVESDEGRGSAFHFTVETEPALPGATADRAAAGTTELGGKAVLIAMESATGLHILDAKCRDWGLAVTGVTGAEAALAVLRRDDAIDCAIIDADLRAMSGVELARAIRAHRPGRRPSLVLLAARAGQASDEALFDARLSKPVRHWQLLATLRQAIGGHHALQPSAQRPGRLDTTLAERLPLHILVAEDSSINRTVALRILDRLGYAADAVASGTQVLERLQASRYDLVFMDLQMPGMDGFEATRRIVAQWPPRLRPRIVAMTANALPGVRDECLKAGMDDYVPKPILPADVQRMIERWAEPRDASLVDMRTLEELRLLDQPGEPSLLEQLIRDYLADAPGYIGAIRQAAAARDSSALAATAHKLSGVSLSMGATGVADVCLSIEREAATGEPGTIASLVDQVELRFARTRTRMSELFA